MGDHDRYPDMDELYGGMPSAPVSTYPVISFDLEQKGAEQGMLNEMKTGQIYRATFNGSPCLVKRDDAGSQPAVSLLIEPGTDGSPERGHWRVMELIREEQKRKSIPARDQFVNSLRAVIAALEERRKNPLVAKKGETNEGTGEALAQYLMDSIGEDNLIVEREEGVFIITIEGEVRLCHAPGLFYDGLHKMFESMATGRVKVKLNTTDEFDAVYKGVPYRETGHTLYLLGTRTFPNGRSQHGQVEVDMAYNPADNWFEYFEIRIFI